VILDQIPFHIKVVIGLHEGVCKIFGQEFCGGSQKGGHGAFRVGADHGHDAACTRVAVGEVGGDSLCGKFAGKDLSQFIAADLAGIATPATQRSQGVNGIGRRPARGGALLPGMGGLVYLPAQDGVNQGHTAPWQIKMAENIIAGQGNHNIHKGIANAEYGRGKCGILHDLCA